MKDDMNSMKNIYKENFRIIKEQNIIIGSTWHKFSFEEDDYHLPETATCSSIHPEFGWLRFNNSDNNIPKRAKDFTQKYGLVWC